MFRQLSMMCFLHNYDVIIICGNTIIPHANLPDTLLKSLLLTNNDQTVTLLLAHSFRTEKLKYASNTNLVHALFKSGIVPLNWDNKELLGSTHKDDMGHEDTEFALAPVILGHNIYLSKEDMKRPSMLQVEEKVKFRYQTEADVQHLVLLAVKDAQKMLRKGLFEFFDVSLEVSFFSYRPDIVVIHHSVLGVILVIEVKKQCKQPHQQCQQGKRKPHRNILPKFLTVLNLILEAIKVGMSKMASSMMTMRVTTHHPSATLKHSTSKKFCPP
jgi:hypothetical protein